MPDQGDAFVRELSALDDAIRAHTQGVRWLNVILGFAGLTMLSLPLLAMSLAGFGAVWAMRRHKLVSVGFALSIAVFAATVHVVWVMPEWTLRRWLDVGLIVATAGDSLVATMAVIRYRRCVTAFDARLQRQQSARPA